LTAHDASLFRPTTIYIAHALGVVARAKGMAEIARETDGVDG
jgi:DNA-binding phage protein